MKILPISLSGSLQNPAWSPDGQTLSLTQWKGGYNRDPATVAVCDMMTHRASILLIGGNNVSQPGSCWNAIRDALVISTDRWHDVDWPAIYTMARPRQLAAIPYRAGFAGYEPAWSPDGGSIVFEQHRRGDPARGQIVIWNGHKFFDVTTEGDCRQPNWSWDGKTLCWQQAIGKDWRVVLYDLKTWGISVPSILGTDITFGPESKIVYSNPDGHLCTWDGANICVQAKGRYFGAPSWSPDGKQIAFETCLGDPDEPDDQGNPKKTQIGVVDV